MLDERKRKLAEGILKGTPRTVIAKELGVNRGTLYEWAKDPDWQAYFENLAGEVEAARRKRLLPITMRAAEAMECALSNAIDAMLSTDLKARLGAPRLETVAEVLKKIVELERLDTGKPTSHTKTERKGEDPRKPSETESKLVKLVEELFDPKRPLPVAEDSASDEAKPN